MTERERAIESVERQLEVSAALRRHLLDAERTGRKIITALHSGVPVSEAVGASGRSAADLRRSTNSVFDEYERARHQMRMAFILPSLDEGLSTADIGRALGVSRQLASRLVQDAKETVAPAAT
jgi:hypothetical protein